MHSALAWIVSIVMVSTTFGAVAIPAALAAPEPQAAPQSITPEAFADIPIVLRLNADSLRPTPAFRDPYYLDFDQLTTVIPGGWAEIPQGGPDAAKIFHYPGASQSWKKISSTYNPGLPMRLNITLNSANESGKVFWFQIDIDLDADGVNDTTIEFDPYTTTQTLEPENVVFDGRFVVGSSTGPMQDARIYLRIWRTDTVAENRNVIARVYAGYIYQSSIILPWINPAPTAVMAKPDNMEAYWTSLPVSYSGSGSSDPSEQLRDLTAKWEFGDGSNPRIVGGDVNITHVYRDPGKYLVNLTITNSLGFADRIQREILVNYKNVPPSVSATLIDGTKTYVGSFDGFAGVPYNVSAVYDDIDNGRENVTLLWNFDDGSTSTLANESHTFNTIGLFNVTLTAYDGTDTSRSNILVNIAQNRAPWVVITAPTRVNKGTPVPFSSLGTIDPDGFPIVSWLWDFGDQFCTDTNPCQSFNPDANHRFDVGGIYNVRLTVSDGISQNFSLHQVKVNQQPLAVCPPPKSIETSRVVTYDGALSRDPDNDPLLFKWKFGDGFETTESLDPTATHIYTVPKPDGYNAQLIVHDGLWSHSCSFTVRVDLINNPPTAAIWCSADTIWLGDTVRCSANQSTDEFELTYLWDFNAEDGLGFNDDFRRDVIITFATPGSYTITLQVKDNKGKTDQVDRNILVKANPGFCNQVFDMSPFLRQTALSPPDQTQGRFVTSDPRVTANITAVKKGCWVAYSIDMRPGESLTVNLDVKSTLEGDVVDLLMFDVAGFLKYKDQDDPVLRDVDSRCFNVTAAGKVSCEFTQPKSGALYIVIDNKDRPVLTPTKGPVEFSLEATMPWTPVNPFSGILWYLVGGAIAAVAIVGAIFFLSRRQEATF